MIAQIKWKFPSSKGNNKCHTEERNENQSHVAVIEVLGIKSDIDNDCYEKKIGKKQLMFFFSGEERKVL